jgi:hypothetical protein
MRILESFHRSESSQLGPALIGAGLVSLLAVSRWPDAPVLTPLALITLGATQITLARFRGSASLVSVAIVHGAIYAGLYGVFVGAVLHTAMFSSTPGINASRALDLVASAVPMALALMRIATCLRQSFVSRR